MNGAAAAGFEARRHAAVILEAVLHRKRPLDEQLETFARESQALPERDRALVRMIAATALRRLGTLRHLIRDFAQRGLPAGTPRVEVALLVGATQILWLDVPDHAAVDLSVRLVQADRRAARYAGLVNALLRRVAREGSAALKEVDAVTLDTPDWLLARWTTAYGAQAARAIAAAHAYEAPLDVSVKADPDRWAAQLSGRVLFEHTVRTPARGPIAKLPGFAEGAWWVQDAAATLPAHLLGSVAGKRVADLCAAPGGKAAQLACAGAEVTVVDRSATRLERLRDNFKRLQIEAEVVTADICAWNGGPFDAVLLDPPCLSTGTIRRHPDIAWLKSERDLVALTALQARLLDRAAGLVEPGGLLVYCTCSLEQEEGEAQIAAFLQRDPRWRRRPVRPDEVSGKAEFINHDGDLRTLPCYLADSDSRFAGLDGFYAARLERVND